MRQIGTAQRLHINRVEEYNGTIKREKTAQRAENTQNNTDDTRPFTTLPNLPENEDLNDGAEEGKHQCRKRTLNTHSKSVYDWLGSRTDRGLLRTLNTIMAAAHRMTLRVAFGRSGMTYSETAT